MFNKFRIGAAGVALISALGMASAAHAVTETATADAVILESLTLTNTDNLDFGTIAVSGAGTVTISTAGAKTCTANLTCSAGNSAAAFDITGNAGATVDIGYPAPATSSITLTNGATGSMGATLNLSAASATLDAAGDASFTVGGVLSVSNGQESGTYQATFPVEVEYQ